MNIFRELLHSFDELGHLNPILLIDELIATSMNGGGVRIGWYGGAAAHAIKHLRDRGVRTWGYRMAYAPDRRWCMVRRRQAEYAVGLLKGAGYAVFEGPFSPPIVTRTTWGVPARPQGYAGLIASLFIGFGARRRRGGKNRGR